MNRLLVYGLQNNALKHILAVPNGLKCQCVCAHCGHALVARNNKQNQKRPHFAHASGKNCDGAFETTLHWLAKELLAKTKQLYLPDFHSDFNPLNPRSFFRQGKMIVFDEIMLEQKIGRYSAALIPDAIGIINGKEIYIEFARTHFIDQRKKRKIKSSQKACIEINLSQQTFDEQSLLNRLHTKNKFVYWINNPRLSKAYKDYSLSMWTEKQNKKLYKEEKNITILKERFALYTANKQYKTLKLDKGGRVSCPKKSASLSQLKTSIYYQHPVLKEIINGIPWNQQIHGKYGQGKWIFLKGKKFTVFYDDEASHTLHEEVIRSCKTFYAGLLAIKKTLECNAVFICGACSCSVELLSFQNESYQVCSY